LASQFGVWHQIAAQALFSEHFFPLWNRFVFGGEPFFAKPQVTVLGLGPLLGGLFPYPFSLKLDMLAHVVLMVAGAVALARQLGAPWMVTSAAAGLLFVNDFYVYHFNRGHLNFVNGFAWTPWLWWALFRAWSARERRPARWALLAGIFGALQVYEGADVTLLYGALMVAALVVCHVIGGQRTAWRRVLVVTGVAALCSAGLAAARLLPMAEYLSLSNRQLGVPWQQAQQSMEQLPRLAMHPVTLGLACLSVVAWRRHSAVILAAWPLAALGAAASHHLPTFKVLFDHAPLFGAQRDPARSEILMVWALPLLLAVAGSGFRRVVKRWRRVACTLLGMGAWVMVAVQFKGLVPGPPVVDWREEQRGNPLLAKVEELTQDQRFHLFENEGRHWGIEHVTMPKGIESVVGSEPAWMAEYMSPQFYMPAQVSFLDGAAVRPARIWGLMSAAYVGSMTPRRVPGFTWIQQVPACERRVCHPLKSAGPFLYRNDQALPRMFSANAAALFWGHGRSADIAFQSLLLDDAWDPRRVVLLRSRAPQEPPTLAEVASADLVIAHESAGGQAVSAAQLTLTGERADAAVLDALRQLAAQSPPVTPVVQERQGQTYRGCPTKARLLVATSKFALVPGWRAEDAEGRPWPLMRANGVAAAVPLVGPGNQGRAGGCITLRYQPTSFVLGVFVSLLTSALALLLLWAERRRRSLVCLPSREAIQR
jgi:hypothetical protein